MQKLGERRWCEPKFFSPPAFRVRSKTNLSISWEQPREILHHAFQPSWALENSLGLIRILRVHELRHESASRIERV